LFEIAFHDRSTNKFSRLAWTTTTAELRMLTLPTTNLLVELNPNNNKKAKDDEKSSSQDNPAEDKSSSEEETHTEEPKPYVTLSPHGKCLDPSRHYRAMTPERVVSFVDTKRVVLMCGSVAVRPDTAINHVVDDRGPLEPRIPRIGRLRFKPEK
jgi:hypothetical protein